MDRLQRSSQKFFDVSGLTKVADGFKSIEQGVVSAGSAVSKIVPIFGTLVGGASIAGFVKLVGLFNDWGIQLGRSAQGLNTTASSLHAYQNAARLAGGSAEEMTEGLKELSRTSADAVLGRNPLAAARFQRAGIALRNNVNGELRNTTELLPEVIGYVNTFTAAQDREQVATELGGKRLADLVETFRMWGKPMSEAIKQARELGLINDKTPEQMLDYRNAVTALSLSFENLGYAITPVLNDALRPLIRDFTGWVQNNSPEIQRAITDIANDFRDWYKSGGAGRLLEGLKLIGRALIWVANHAEAIAITFAVLWGVKAVIGIANIATALGIVGTGALGAGGTGLLGSLGAVLAIATKLSLVLSLLSLKGDAGPGSHPDAISPEAANKASEDYNKRQGYTGNLWTDIGKWWRGEAGNRGGAPGAGGAGTPEGSRMPHGGGGGVAGAGGLPPAAQEAISRAEGTMGKSGIDWNVQSGEQPGATSANLENMSLAEVRALRGPDFGGLQINRVHLNPQTAAALGYDMSTKFTKDVQQKFGSYIHREQGLGAWRGFNAHPDERQRADEAIRSGQSPGVNASPEGPPVPPGAATFITHHTGSRGTTQNVIDTLNQRGLGVQYIMDREGNITATGMQGTHIRTNEQMGLSNRNTVGMEVIAKDDKDILPVQVEAFKKFWAQHPEFKAIYGHGEVNEHKQETEGATIAGAVRAMGDAAHLGAPMAQGAMLDEVRRSAEAPPLEVKGGGTGRGLKGSVDVTVTHKKAPAATPAETKGASATVPPVRTETADMSAI